LLNYLFAKFAYCFQAIVLSRLLYGLPAWGLLLNVESINRVGSFLNRCHHYGFTQWTHIHTTTDWFSYETVVW